MRRLIIQLLFSGDALALRTFELIQKRREAFKLNRQKKELEAEAQELMQKISIKSADILEAKAEYLDIREAVEEAYALNLD